MGNAATDLSASLTIDDIVLANLKSSSITPLAPALASRLIRNGLKGSTLRAAVEHGLPRGLISQALGVEKSNLSKLYQRARLSPVQTEEVSDITSLWAEIYRFFDNDREMAHDWIDSSLAALGDVTPLSLMDTFNGRQCVRRLLDNMMTGDVA